MRFFHNIILSNMLFIVVSYSHLSEKAIFFLLLASRDAVRLILVPWKAQWLKFRVLGLEQRGAGSNPALCVMQFLVRIGKEARRIAEWKQ
jgi:hypothetical protein